MAYAETEAQATGAHGVKAMFNDQLVLTCVMIVSFVASVGASGLEMWRSKVLKMQAEDIEREHQRARECEDQLEKYRIETKRLNDDNKKCREQIAALQKRLHDRKTRDQETDA